MRSEESTQQNMNVPYELIKSIDAIKSGLKIRDFHVQPVMAPQPAVARIDSKTV